ncbi:Flp pilus assembly protein TadD, contains TPR repeats [Devosia crocina]|uniref:Flp pilus assembly protein TadD, contains TPR repeats n=1 Tax=Devosia crocina TaxID=429728 RepID=A0A1I7NNK1_9HYPH|nr:Flp pilus assembly protein TadD, contains TPR repeats [Devosia crocina]
MPPNPAFVAQGDICNVNLLSNRLARPLFAALIAAALVPSASAQTASSTIYDMLQLFRPSATGSYLAGRQALGELHTGEAARYFNEAAQGDWDNPVLIERSFIAFAANGQVQQSAQVAKRLIELIGTNELAQLVVATQAVKERRYGAAERAMGELSQDTFTGITAGILRAWAMVGEGRVAEADSLMVELGSTGLEDFLVFHRALMAEVAGQRDKAMDLAQRAYDNEPYVARMVEIYARMLANDGQFEAASDVIAAFEERGLTHPLVTVVKQSVEARRRPGVFATSVQIGASEMFHGMGVALSRDGSSDLAMVFLRLGQYLDPQADVIGLAVGSLFDASGQHESANAVYDAIPSASAMKPLAVVRIAQNLDSMGDRAEALRRLRNIVATRPDDLDAVSVLGDLLRYDEQYTEAADAYTKALEISGGEAPADWRFYYVRGIAYERAKEWPQAETDFLKALDLNPGQPAVLNYLGYSWIDMDMHLERALEMIEQAVEAQPQDGYIVDSLGWAFYKLGRIDEAVETLERAVMLRPNDAEINDHLGDAYWKAGRRLEAGFQWNVARSVDEVGNVAERVAPKLVDGLTPETEIVTD